MPNMNILNLEKFQQKPITMFIQTLLGYEYFITWSTQITKSDNIQFVVVDTGQQEVLKTIIDFPIFQTERNIGCAGSWNLICNLAFNHFGLDKIVIGQDDSICTEQMITSIWERTDDDTIVGGYDRSFEFALFGITKTYWSTVGMFDENFIFAGCEDNDYKHRAKLLNKQITSLNYSADLNSSICSKVLGEDLKPSNEYNANYIKQKWGSNYEFITPFNHPSLSPTECGIATTLSSMYNCEVFPSILEFRSVQELTQ